jgi:undecaprenyl-diphosphatase
LHEIIKFVAGYFIAIPVAITAYLLWKQKQAERLRFVAILLVGGVVALAFAWLASSLYYDPRPFVQGHFTPLLPHGTDNGFPSDHTLFSAFLAWAVLYYNRKLGVILLVVAALIGGARMAAGIHHLSDVIASFVLAAIGAGLAVAVVGFTKRRHTP